MGPPGGAQPGGAALEQGDLAGAEAAFQQAIDSGHADWAPQAAFERGMLLREQGDLAGAEAAFQQAIDSGRAEAAVAGTAKFYLEGLLENQGEVYEWAKAFYQRAIDSGHAEASLGLGELLEDSGRLGEGQSRLPAGY